jgi:4-amino-4-deoxy-L-arabinose transferase-like glycosyltransferase/predicted TPR repeat methyltransferase
MQLALGAVLLAGFALRLHGLGQPSLWLDEMGQASVASAGLQVALEGARTHHGAAPLDYVLSWLALRVAHSDFVVRLPAAMLGTLTLALVYRLGRELFGSLTGLLAAVLLAVAPLHLRYSQEARFYALFTALTVASTLALVMALRRNSRTAWTVYTLTLIAALYSHYYTVLLVLAQAIVVLAQPLFTSSSVQRSHLRRNYLMSWVVAGVAFLPWFFYAVLGETGTMRATPPQIDARLLTELFHGLALGEVRAEPVSASWLLGGLVVVGAATGLAQRRTRWRVLLLLTPLLICPLLVVLVLRWIGYFFALRQMLFLLPFYLLLAALGVTHIARWLGDLTQGRRWSSIAQAVVVLGLMVTLLLLLRPAAASNVAAPRQDWRAALEFAIVNAGPDDAILVPGIPAHYLPYYGSSAGSRLAGPQTLPQTQALASNAPAVWVLAAEEAVAGQGRLFSWLREINAFSVPFGADLTVYYWQAGSDRASLLAQSLRWQPPRNLAALEHLVYQYDQADLPAAAANAAAQGAALAANRERASFFEMLRGSVWRDRSESLAAVAAFQRALALWPDNVEVLVRMGEQLLALDRKAEAAAALQRAAALAPDNYWAYRLLAEAQRRQGHLDEAVVAYRTAIAINPAEAETYALLGDVLADAGDRNAAIAAYEQFMQRASDGPGAAAVQQKLSELRRSP